MARERPVRSRLGDGRGLRASVDGQWVLAVGRARKARSVLMYSTGIQPFARPQRGRDAIASASEVSRCPRASNRPAHCRFPSATPCRSSSRFEWMCLPARRSAQMWHQVLHTDTPTVVISRTHPATVGPARSKVGRSSRPAAPEAEVCILSKVPLEIRGSTGRPRADSRRVADHVDDLE